MARAAGAEDAQSRMRYGYGLLMLSVVVSYVIALIIEGSNIRLSVLIGVQLLTIWLAMRVSQAPRLTRIAGFALAILIVGVIASAFFGQAAGTLAGINRWLFVLSTLLYLVAPIVIVRHVVMRKNMDLEALLGVITAYVLIGMAFAFVYRVLGSWQDSAFFGAAGDGSLADDLFFSFTSLTTVGYGDLVPAGNPGQSLAIFEAVFGQLFLVIVVAKVVTGLTRKQEEQILDEGDGTG